tara:strand:- start:2732 stop:2953 length:222 start_codon:yes stop_codon:yes gene_type:complete
MNKGKLKVLIRALKEIQEELESEIYSDTEAYVAPSQSDTPSAFTPLSDNDDAIAHHVAAPLDGAVELWDDSEE